MSASSIVQMSPAGQFDPPRTQRHVTQAAFLVRVVRVLVIDSDVRVTERAGVGLVRALARVDRLVK